MRGRIVSTRETKTIREKKSRTNLMGNKTWFKKEKN